MSNIQFLKSLNFGIFTIMVVITVFVAIFTYIFKSFASGNGLIAFAVQNHLAIMIIAMVITLAYGFFWSTTLHNQIKEQQKDTADIFSIVLDFLSPEEKLVLKHLVRNNSESTQAKIAHLDDMGAVKALRTVQKMQEKKLLSIEKEGKIRRIILKDNIQNLLEGSKE